MFSDRILSSANRKLCCRFWRIKFRKCISSRDPGNPFRILRSPLSQGTYHTLHSSSKRARYQGLSRFLILPAKIRRLESILSDFTESPSSEFHSTIFHFYRGPYIENILEKFFIFLCMWPRANIYNTFNQ